MHRARAVLAGEERELANLKRGVLSDFFCANISELLLALSILWKLRLYYLVILHPPVPDISV